MIASVIGGGTRVARRLKRRATILIGGLVLFVSASGARGDDAKAVNKKPDSGRILVWAFERKIGVPPEQRGNQNIRLLAVDPETGESTTLATPEKMGGSVTPDGRSMAINRDRRGTPGEGIWVHDLGGTNPPRKLYDRSGSVHWLNNGKEAIIVDPLPERRCLTYRVKADGTGTTPLPIPATDHVESCTPDGLWLAARDRSDEDRTRTRIQVMHPDGTAKRTLVDEKDMPFADFKLSPDGTKLAYVKISLDKVPLPDATCSVWIVNTNGEGREQVPIPLATGDLVQVRWSPDGKRFALGLRDQMVPRSRNVEDRIVVVDVDGSKMRTLPLPPSKLLLSDWLPAIGK